jgi:DHA1 family bicyclomycin/chloramphenicol resistance-like MFS transporter
MEIKGSIVAILARTIICAMLFDAVIPLSPFMVEDLGVAEGFFKSALTLGMFIFAVFQLLSGPLVASLGTHLSLCGASMATGVACLALASSQGAGSLAAALLAMFVVNAVASVSGRGLLRSLVNHADYQKLSAYVLSSMSAIGIVSPLLLVYLSQAYGWRWPLMALGATLCLVTVLLFLDRNVEVAEPGKNRLELRDGLSLIKERMFIFPVLIGVGAQGIYTSLFISKPFIMLDRFGLSATSLGITLSLFAALGVLGFFVSGKSVNHLSEKSRVWAGLSMEASSVALLIAAEVGDSFACFALAVAAWTFAFSFLLPWSSAQALNVRPAALAPASALYGFIQAGGAALVAYLSTLDVLPALSGLSLSAAVCLLLGIVAVKCCGSAADGAALKPAD